MGCSGSRGKKDPNQDILHFRILKAKNLIISADNLNNVDAYRYIHLEMDPKYLYKKESIKTNEFSDTSGEFRFSDNFRMDDEHQDQRILVTVSIRQLIKENQYQKKKAEKQQVLGKSETQRMKGYMGMNKLTTNMVNYMYQLEDDTILSHGILDVTDLLKNKGQWYNGWVHLYSSSGILQPMGAVYLQSSFYDYFPDDLENSDYPEISNEKYIPRNISKMILDMEIDNVEIPWRDGILTLVVNGLKLNDLLKNVQGFDLKGQIIINGENMDIDEDAEQFQLQQSIVYNIPMRFNPLSIQNSGIIRIFKNEIEESQIITEFDFDINDAIKKHGVWAINQSFKSLYGDFDVSQHKIKYPVIKLQIKFNYMHCDYPKLKDPNEEIEYKDTSKFEKGILFVNVIKARNLLKLDDVNKDRQSDPFVEFQTNIKPKEIQFTHVIQNDLNPNWSARRRINVKVNPQKIDQYVVNFKVFDRDPFNQELQGNVEINIEKVLKKGEWINGWHKLENLLYSKTKTQFGDLYIQIGYKKVGDAKKTKQPAVKT